MKNNMLISVLAALLPIGAIGLNAQSRELLTMLNNPNHRITETTGLPDVNNHDVSNVIFYEGKYHLWITEHYSRNYDGFRDTRIDHLSSEDGIRWGNRDIALEPDPERPFESRGVLTCYIVPSDAKFYLFYTGVHEKGGGDKRILYAVAGHPDGPWIRSENNLILESEDMDGWEGVGPDDVNILFREGKWWMYYKGRRSNCKRWQDTEVGIAFSENLTGPYERYIYNPILYGHALGLWKQGNGVAALFSNGRDSKIYWAEDGLHFMPYGEFPHSTPGVYCPDNFQEEFSRGIKWGVDTGYGIKNENLVNRYDNMKVKRNRVQQRFDCDMWLGEIK